MNKYKAVKTEVDGIRFDSRKEAARWLELRAMEQAGEISDLIRQVRFDLNVNGQKVCVYVADFAYERAGQVTVEDVKGIKTPLYRLKKRLLKACLGYDILES